MEELGEYKILDRSFLTLGKVVKGLKKTREERDKKNKQHHGPLAGDVPTNTNKWRYCIYKGLELNLKNKEGKQFLEELNRL